MFIVLEVSISFKACTIRNWIEESWDFLGDISQKVGNWLVFIFVLLLILRRNLEQIRTNNHYQTMQSNFTL